MSFEINGNTGKYSSNTNISSSEKYGKNSVDNYKKFVTSPLNDIDKPMLPMLDYSLSEDATDKNLEKIEQFSKENDAYLESLPPLEFEYRYMPSGKFDKQSLFSAAEEEMEADAMPIKDFEEKYLISDDLTAEPIDINKDGIIDKKEYSTTILAADMLSKDTPSLSNIDGSINKLGANKILEYTQKCNAKAATDLYSNIYSHFELDKE